MSNKIDDILSGLTGASKLDEAMKLLRDLDDQMRIFNKRYAGSVGGSESERLSNVKFQTFAKYGTWPNAAKICYISAAMVSPFDRVPAKGNTRVLGMVLSGISSIGNNPMGSHAVGELVWESSGGGLVTIARLVINPTIPTQSVFFAPPYPSMYLNQTVIPNVLVDAQQAVLKMKFAYNVNDFVTANIHYIDELDLS